MNNIGGIGVTLKAEFDDSGLVKGYAQVKSNSEQVRNQLKQTDTQLKQSQGLFTKYYSLLGQKIKGVTQSFRVQKGAAAQMGMQLQDVAVMAQYGADKMVILGQQGSQIASLFGPGGAMLGALIAIGSAVWGVSSKMGEAAKETENLEDKLRSLAETSALTADEQAYLNELDKKSVSEKKKRVAEIEREVAAEAKRLEAMKSAGTGLDTGQFAVPRSAEQNQSRYADSITKTTATVVKLRAELAFLNRQLSDDTGGDTKQSDYNLERVNRLRESIDVEKGLLQTRRQLNYAVENDIISAQRAAIMMKDSQDNARIDAKLARTEEALIKERELIRNDALLTNEEKLANEQVINKALAEARHLAGEQRLQATKENNDAITKLEKQAADKRIQQAERERQQKLSIYSGMMGNLSSLMNTGSRKMFEIGKAASVAGALIDGYAAMTGAYKVGAKIGGPALGAAYAATAGIATAAQIKQIQNTKFGQAQPGQSYQGGQVVNNTSQPRQPDRNISIALTGSNFSGGDIRSLIGAINEELGDGATLNVTGG